MKKLIRTLLPLLAVSFLLEACQTIELYEKSVTIPGHAWENSYKPAFSFIIKDTSVSYQPFIVLRHTDKYNYNNIYVNLHVKIPGSDSIRIIRKDLQLATNDKGWLASGMDDIYEHRIKLGEPEQLRTGEYSFTIEQIMRENPLKHVMNVGLRLEKKIN